jgi:hypothetical protein
MKKYWLYFEAEKQTPDEDPNRVVYNNGRPGTETEIAEEFTRICFQLRQRGLRVSRLGTVWSVFVGAKYLGSIHRSRKDPLRETQVV